MSTSRVRSTRRTRLGRGRSSCTIVGVPGPRPAWLISSRGMKELKGKVAVVTGAASGIGRAMAERFGREGMKVVLADVEEKPLAEAGEALAETGVEAIAVRTNVSRWEDVDALATRTIDAFGGAHVVCNNAGIGAGGLIWDGPLADWVRRLGVNLMGVVHGIRAFLPRMIAQGERHVANTPPIAGLITGS